MNGVSALRTDLPRQLALALPLAESFAREDFFESPANAGALALIDAWPDWPSRTVILVGQEGTGKSHLAAIWSALAGARFLAGKALNPAGVPAALSTGALVLENLAPLQFDQRALFHLFNMVQEQKAFVLITATAHPAGWSLDLPDLASRLRALPVVELSPPDDKLLRAVLVKLLTDRQIIADEGLVAYLLSRLERSLAAARAAVEWLDRESLRQKRPVTRVLAAELFKDKL